MISPVCSMDLTGGVPRLSIHHPVSRRPAGVGEHVGGLSERLTARLAAAARGAGLPIATGGIAAATTALRVVCAESADSTPQHCTAIVDLHPGDGPAPGRPDRRRLRCGLSSLIVRNRHSVKGASSRTICRMRSRV